LELRNAGQSIAVKITNITKANDAAKTASRLNFRIRLWYPAAQPISPSLTELPCAASTNPLAFTFQFLAGRGHSDNDAEKQSTVMETLKNTDVYVEEKTNFRTTAVG